MNDKWIYTTTGHETNKHIKVKHFELFLRKTNRQKSDVSGSQYAKWMKHHIQAYKTIHGLTDTTWLYAERADDFIAYLENTKPENEANRP